jgi:chromosome segregation ATPase
MKLSPQDLNGYLLEALKPIVIALLINFIFELAIIYCFIWAYLVWLAFLAYRGFTLHSQAYYLPQIQSLQSQLNQVSERKAKLETAFEDLMTYSQNLKILKAEGEASLKAFISNLEGEYKLVQQRVKLLESGEELVKLRWELSQIEQTSKSNLLSAEKQVTRLREQVTQLEKQVSQKSEQVTQLEKQVTTLQAEAATYKEVSDAREITKLKQSFHALLERGDNLTKLLEVVSELEKRGVSPESLCATEEKKQKWQNLLGQMVVQ